MIMPAAPEAARARSVAVGALAPRLLVAGLGIIITTCTSISNRVGDSVGTVRARSLIRRADNYLYGSVTFTTRDLRPQRAEVMAGRMGNPRFSARTHTVRSGNFAAYVDWVQAHTITMFVLAIAATLGSAENLWHATPQSRGIGAGVPITVRPPAAPHAALALSAFWLAVLAAVVVSLLLAHTPWLESIADQAAYQDALTIDRTLTNDGAADECTPRPLASARECTLAMDRVRAQRQHVAFGAAIAMAVFFFSLLWQLPGRSEGGRCTRISLR